MSFFDSEIVQQEMKEISELQDEIYMKVFSFSSMDSDDKLQHVENFLRHYSRNRRFFIRDSLCLRIWKQNE